MQMAQIDHSPMIAKSSIAEQLRNRSQDCDLATQVEHQAVRLPSDYSDIAESAHDKEQASKPYCRIEPVPRGALITAWGTSAVCAAMAVYQFAMSNPRVGVLSAISALVWCLAFGSWKSQVDSTTKGKEE